MNRGKTQMTKTHGTQCHQVCTNRCLFTVANTKTYFQLFTVTDINYSIHYYSANIHYIALKQSQIQHYWMLWPCNHADDLPHQSSPYSLALKALKLCKSVYRFTELKVVKPLVYYPQNFIPMFFLEQGDSALCMWSNILLRCSTTASLGVMLNPVQAVTLVYRCMFTGVCPSCTAAKNLWPVLVIWCNSKVAKSALSIHKWVVIQLWLLPTNLLMQSMLTQMSLKQTKRKTSVIFIGAHL